jgi:general secretion pathway protein J
MALAFAIVRSTLAISTRGELIASQNERMRGVEGFLRRRLMATLTQPLPAEPGSLSAVAVMFDGQPQQMRFVADVPGYLGRGGPYLHDLQVSGDGARQQLRIDLTLLQNGQPLPENPPRGIDPQSGTMGPWQDRWNVPGRMPALVAIDIVPAEGAAWPTLVVAVPQYGATPGGWR